MMASCDGFVTPAVGHKSEEDAAIKGRLKKLVAWVDVILRLLSELWRAGERVMWGIRDQSGGWISAFEDRLGQIDFRCKMLQSSFKFKIRFTV
jgi:hypothetical protein